MCGVCVCKNTIENKVCVSIVVFSLCGFTLHHCS